jgi:hypothetical protein
MSRGLQLEFSMGGRDNDTLEATYRNEGLSVGADHMVRFFLSARLVGSLMFPFFACRDYSEKMLRFEFFSILILCYFKKSLF